MNIEKHISGISSAVLVMITNVLLRQESTRQ